MTSGVAVFDATPLIAFQQIGRLDLLQGLFDRILVPTIVANEARPSLGGLPHWMDVRDLHEVPAFRRKLDLGERAAIALAMQRAASFVILDDLVARLVAAEAGLTVTGSLGLLVRAKRHGLLGDVRPIMDAMIGNGLFASEALYRQILGLAGEGDPHESGS